MVKDSDRPDKKSKKSDKSSKKDKKSLKDKKRDKKSKRKLSDEVIQTSDDEAVLETTVAPVVAVVEAPKAPVKLQWLPK